MITQGDATIIDGALAQLPCLLASKGLGYVQRRGYKAFKLPGKRRNWFQFNDGNVPLNIRFADTRGQTKTWKLFARFPADKAPSWPWDKPERYERKKAYWMLAGEKEDDVWGIAYEDIKVWGEQMTSQQILNCLQSALQDSFAYSCRRYGCHRNR